MKFSCYSSVKSARPEECTYEKFLELTHSQELLDRLRRIGAETDKDERGRLKKELPIITWQAYFEGKRLNAFAKPSGLFMLDLDGIENPVKWYNSNICGADKKTRGGILLVHVTPSCKGLRIIAKCREEFSTLEECQRWLATLLGAEEYFDSVCKDFARSSYIVHESYILYMDAKSIWEVEVDPACIYKVDAKPPVIKNAEEKPTPDNETDQREGLFGGQSEYRGLALTKIAGEWLDSTGGMPQEGERNARLYKLALRMRYLTDFNAATLFRVMPHCGLPDDEMKQLIQSALSTTRAQDIPHDLKDVIENMLQRQKLGDVDDLPEESAVVIPPMPSLPPIFREFTDVAPNDFKRAVTLCQLPILGALGSRLRAKYLDGKMHSPSFQVSLEAPQASGKSFMTRLVEYELGQMLEHDEAEREREREYDNKVREMKLLNIKVTKENKEEVIGSRPKTLIRYVPATMSITKLLMRMDAAQGLHLFAMSEEIDTVTKAFKRGFSSYSDLLRVAFDNGLYGQDYASENSFSGIIPIYYNFLTSGTPKAMRRFYPDVEDGLVSRVCFVTLPDQFGKPMPVWREFTKDQKANVDVALVRLNEVTIQGDTVQPEHELKLNFLNKALEQWILKQQAISVKHDDRTRDVFCRRSAVVGFRAGMLAYFLWGEKNTPTIRRNTCEFAIWVATCMLYQHMLRFNVDKVTSNVFKWQDVYKRLDDTFTRVDLEMALKACNVESPARQVIYQWRMLGVIETTKKNRDAVKNQKQHAEFKKIKQQ